MSLMELIFINLKSTIAENHIISEIKIIRIIDKIKFKLAKVEDRPNKIKPKQKPNIVIINNGLKTLMETLSFFNNIRK
jgi:hypothetical protein